MAETKKVSVQAKENMSVSEAQTLIEKFMKKEVK